MSSMRASAYLTLVLALFGHGRPSAAQEATGGLEARVWLDQGEEPVLRRGEEVRVYYRTNEDAFAAIFRIDTDGRVHLIYPQHPDAIDVVLGQRDYRLLFPDAPSWRVTEDPGVGYLFIIASPEPLDFSRFPYDEWEGWDVSGVGEVVYSDPYVAIDDYVAEIVPDWEFVPYALDFVTYTVGEVYSYPRFLCYDCHTYRSYSSWNPYDYTCSTYRVVIWDDPYFYPRYRYSGVNVVFASSVWASLPRYEVTRRVVGDAVAPIVRVRSLSERRAIAYKEPAATAAPRTGAAAARRSGSPTVAEPTARRGTSAATAAPAARRGTGASTAAPAERRSTSPTPTARRSPAAAPTVQERPRSTAAPQQVPDTARARPTLQRRPSARLPVRTPPAARGAPTEPTPRAAPSRPTGQPSSGSRREPQSAPRPQVAPEQPRSAPSQARPSTRTPPQTSPAPTEPRVRAVPSPSRQPQGDARPQAAPSRGRRPEGGPSAAPSARSPASDRPNVRSGPSRPSPAVGSPRPDRPSGGAQRAAPSRPERSSGGAARAEPSRPSSSPPARASAPPRSAEPRPTVRARPAEPAPRN